MGSTLAQQYIVIMFCNQNKLLFSAQFLNALPGIYLFIELVNISYVFIYF